MDTKKIIKLVKVLVEAEVNKTRTVSNKDFS